jgi:hypothetical protein
VPNYHTLAVETVCDILARRGVILRSSPPRLSPERLARRDRMSQFVPISAHWRDMAHLAHVVAQHLAREAEPTDDGRLAIRG